MVFAINFAQKEKIKRYKKQNIRAGRIDAEPRILKKIWLCVFYAKKEIL